MSLKISTLFLTVRLITLFLQFVCGFDTPSCPDIEDFEPYILLPIYFSFLFISSYELHVTQIIFSPIILSESFFNFFNLFPFSIWRSLKLFPANSICPLLLFLLLSFFLFFHLLSYSFLLFLYLFLSFFIFFYCWSFS